MRDMSRMVYFDLWGFLVKGGCGRDGDSGLCPKEQLMHLVSS